MFYQAYRMEKARPTANAIAALHYAAALAPQDSLLRLTNARQFLADGKPADARKALVPLAYNPHSGKLGDEARRLIGLIDSGQAKDAAAAGPTLD
jgi:predicted Zn-dependent protease